MNNAPRCGTRNNAACTAVRYESYWILTPACTDGSKIPDVLAIAMLDFSLYGLITANPVDSSANCETEHEYGILSGGTRFNSCQLWNAWYIEKERCGFTRVGDLRSVGEESETRIWR